MKIIYNPETDPRFNLAAEEYLLRNEGEDTIMLWQNDKAVIIGKNQNAAEEVNLLFAEQNGISVVRRITGGGAVYHDLGNINFTFVADYRDGEYNNYERFTRPVCDCLYTLGIEATLSGRNDVLVDGMKISGNAQTVKNGRIMHHGTLLLSADVETMQGVLSPKEIKFQSKSVKSVRSRVTNLKDRLPKGMGVRDFLNYLLEFLKDQYACEGYTFCEADVEGINRIKSERYDRFEWNIGASPRANMENERRFDFGTVKVSALCEGGVIADIAIRGDFFGLSDISQLEEQIKGTPVSPDKIREKLEKIDVSQYISQMTRDQLMSLIV